MRPLFLLLLAFPASADEFKIPTVKIEFKKTASPPGEDAKKSVEGTLKKQYEFLSASHGGPDNIPPARMKELKERLDGVSGCEDKPFKPASNPDCGGSAFTCTGDMYDLMTHGKGNTDRSANAGLIRYARTSVMSDPILYASAFSFYKKLKEDVDLAAGSPVPGAGAGADIGRKASKNLFALSQDVIKEGMGKPDAFLAIKTLILYGHDNRFNYLSVGDSSNACQLKTLDAMKPNANSNLYLNGAIGREYWEDEVERGKRVHKECKEAAKGRTVEDDMCGEYTSYQADYYHVIASAFLHCHCMARGSSVIDDATASLQKDGYLFMVAKYKIDRFTEEIKAALGNAGHTPAVRLLEHAFLTKGDKFGVGADGWKITCDKAKASSCLDAAQVDSWPWASWCGELGGACKEPDVALAKALAKRYVFDVNFRVSQHFQGILFAKDQCRGAKLDHGSCQ